MALNQDAIKPAEFVRNVFAVTLPIGTPFEEVTKPEFWAHTAAKFHPTDRVEIMDAECTYFAEAIVISCARNWAKLSVLRFNELSESKPHVSTNVAERDKFKVDWTQNTKARVVRIADKQVIKEFVPSKADAEKWLTTYIDGMAV